MEFRYIKDFYGMTAKELENTTVRCGNVDYHALYQFLYKEEPTKSELEKMKQAVTEAIKSFSACHMDLLVAEFGKEETTAAEFMTSCDTMFEKPGDSLEQKLRAALTVVRAAYKRAAS